MIKLYDNDVIINVVGLIVMTLCLFFVCFFQFFVGSEVILCFGS